MKLKERERVGNNIGCGLEDLFRVFGNKGKEPGLQHYHNQSGRFTMASATMCAYLVVSGMKEKSGVHVFGILWKHTTSVCIRVFTRETTKVSVTYLFLFPKPT